MRHAPFCPAGGGEGADCLLRYSRDVDTIVVTGGAGFIGSNFVRHALARTGARVVVLDKLTYAVTSRAWPTSRPIPATLRQADIATARPCARLPPAPAVGGRELRGRDARGPLDRRPASFVRTNVAGAFELLEAARLFLREHPSDAFRFLHVSTDEVYGTLGATGAFSEETPYAPNSPYAASKAGPTISCARTTRPTACPFSSPTARTTTVPASSPRSSSPDI